MLILPIIVCGPLWLLSWIPAIIILARRKKVQTAQQTWLRTTGTIMRVDQETYAVPANDTTSYRTRLVGRYQYADPRGGVHWGRTVVRGIDLRGPEPVPVLVNPANWDESMVVTGPESGCALGAAFVLPAMTTLLLLAMAVMFATLFRF